MKNPFIYLFAVVMSTLSLTSCSSDDDNGSVSKSREVKYELTGSTTATDISAAVITNGGSTNVDIESLPWNHTFTANSNTSGVGFGITGSNATPGDKLTLHIYQGTTELESLEVTANSDGIITGTLAGILK
ncbi:hypothetical protein ACX0HA_15275 [Flavobacterium hauense]